MEDIGDFLLRLYAYARECGPDDFQGRVLDDLRCAFAFSSAFWCNGRVSMANGRGLLPTAFHLHELEPEFLTGWSDMIPRDPVLLQITAAPGRARCVRVSQAYRAVPEGVELAASHAIRSFAAILVPGLAHEDIQFLSLYQPGLDLDATGSEIRWLEYAAPHLAEAWRVHRALHSPRRGPEPPADGIHIAIAERSNGRLLQSDDGFLALLARDWPQFDGRQVPAPLRQAWIGCTEFRHLGRVARYDGRGSGGTLVHLSARARSRAEDLTQRQSQVAALYVQGLSYKEIAQRCRMCPATVRNHLSAVYETLGVHNKLALAELLGPSIGERRG